MSITPWQHLVRLLEDGQAVDAANTNQPTSDVIQRTQHLKDLLDQLSAGEALFYRGVPVEDTSLVGQPVYLNKATGVFSSALTTLDLDEDGIWGVPAASTYAWGIIVSKSTATTADIALSGIVRDVDLTGAMLSGETPSTGPYFVSSKESGKLERIKSPASPFVLYHWAEEGITLVMPDVSGGMEDHIHYRFQLTAQPAGTPNNPTNGVFSGISADWSKVRV